jgi:hypothetical protein
MPAPWHPKNRRYHSISTINQLIVAACGGWKPVAAPDCHFIKFCCAGRQQLARDLRRI